MKQVCCFMIWVALIRNIIYIFPSVTLRCPAELLWYIVGPHCCIFVSPYMFYNFIQKKCGVVERTNPVFYCLLEVWSWAIPLRVCVYIYIYIYLVYILHLLPASILLSAGDMIVNKMETSRAHTLL